MIHDFPICVAKDGTIIVALQWDYAAWTPGAASFTGDMRQKSLINELNHAFIVQLAPDGSEMFTANFHNPEDGLRAGHLQRSLLVIFLDINSHCDRPMDIFPAGALPEFSTAKIVVGHQNDGAYDTRLA